MREGKLRITGTFDDTATPALLTMKTDIDDFKVVRAPILARLLSLASLTGFADLLSGDGISFEALRSNASWQDDVIHIQDLEMYSSSIALDMNGYVNLATDELEFKGTVAPANTVNELIGDIPLLGDILTGGGSEKLFAARFSVDGNVDDPSVLVNPLSALTPGFLRGIFNSEVKPIDGVTQEMEEAEKEGEKVE